MFLAFTVPSTRNHDLNHPLPLLEDKPLFQINFHLLWWVLQGSWAWHVCICSQLLYLLTYLLTYSMVQSPSEKLTGLQLVKKYPAFHGTRRFITALTSIRHLSLSWASPIQSIYPHPTSWRSVLILSTHLRLGLPNFQPLYLNKISMGLHFHWRFISIGRSYAVLQTPCDLEILSNST